MLGAIHSTKISGNFGPNLNGSVRSNRKSFEKTGPPFEVVLFSRSDRSEFWLNGSRPLKRKTNVRNQIDIYDSFRTVFNFWSNRELWYSNVLHSQGLLIFSVFDREKIHCFLYYTIIEHINNLFIEKTIMNVNRKDLFDLVKSRTWKFLMTLLLVFLLFPPNCKQSTLFM